MTVQGVGVCPKHEGGHVFVSWKVDERRPCEFCGRPGRDNVGDGESGGFLAEATMARTELFSGLGFPASSTGGKASQT